MAKIGVEPDLKPNRYFEQALGCQLILRLRRKDREVTGWRPF